MAPQLVDIDQERDEGAVLFRIGGAYWVAPEPSIETLKQIVQGDVQAYVRAGQLIREYTEGDPTFDPAHDPSVATMSGIEALIPQLQQLLFAANEAGAYVHVQYTTPEELAAQGTVRPEGDTSPPQPVPPAGVLVPGQVCGEDERTAIPTAWCRTHLSAKRAGRILAAVLGEGRVPVAVGN